MIEKLSSQFALPLTENQVAGLNALSSMVDQWRQRTDLFGGKTQDELALILFGDAFALKASTFLDEMGTCADVGAGGGAPGLPLAVLCPNIALTLIEKRRKRVAFMRLAVGALARIDPGIAERAQIVEADVMGLGLTFDVAYSRATFQPSDWLAIGQTLARRTIVMTNADPTTVDADGMNASVPNSKVSISASEIEKNASTADDESAARTAKRKRPDPALASRADGCFRYRLEAGPEVKHRVLYAFDTKRP